MAAKPARLTLKRALQEGLRLPMACVIGLEGLRREGHDVYVLPKGAGGSRFPQYLVVELKGATSIDVARICPDALVARDGVLTRTGAERDSFEQQFLDWSHRRWVGSPGYKTIEAPGIDVELWPRASTLYGPMLYWHVSRGPAKTFEMGEDPIRKHSWHVAVDDRDVSRGYVAVATGRVWTYGDHSPWDPQGQFAFAATEDSSRITPADFARDAKLAVAAMELARAEGWVPAQLPARANPTRPRATDWFAHHLSYDFYRVSERDATALVKDARARLPRPGYELAVELPNGTPVWLSRTPHGTLPGGGWAYVWSIHARGFDRTLREESARRDRVLAGQKG